MISENFIFLVIIINLMGSIGYSLSTLRGETKPNRVTWFLWALIPIVACIIQIGEGVGLQTLFTFMAGFGPLLIFLASFKDKKAYWKISKFDIVCGSISIFAFILWLATGSGVLAILLSIVADFMAGVPTLVKSFNFPESENSIAYRNGAISGTITLLTVNNWSFIEYSFALYIVSFCIVLYILVRFKFGLILKQRLTKLS